MMERFNKLLTASQLNCRALWLCCACMTFLTTVALQADCDTVLAQEVWASSTPLQFGRYDEKEVREILRTKKPLLLVLSADWTLSSRAAIGVLRTRTSFRDIVKRNKIHLVEYDASNDKKEVDLSMLGIKRTDLAPPMVIFWADGGDALIFDDISDSGIDKIEKAISTLLAVQK